VLVLLVTLNKVSLSYHFVWSILVFGDGDGDEGFRVEEPLLFTCFAMCGMQRYFALG